MSQLRTDPQPQFVALAGLRGIAALIVVQWHGYRFLGGTALPAGYLAVDFFFLLSGWVLAHAYDRRLETSMSAGQFLGARLIRLYPVYLLALAPAAAAAALTGTFSLQWLAAALVFLPDFWVANFVWLIPPSWSLVAEFAANLPFALAHRRLGTLALTATVALGFLGLAAVAILFGSLDAGYSGASWGAMFARVFFSFPLGVLLYRHRTTLAKWAPLWSIWPAMALLVAVLAIPAAGRGDIRDLTVVCLLLPAVLLFASNARPRRPATYIAAALGDLSYPLYLLHVPIFGIANAALISVSGPGLDAAHLTLALPLLGGMLAISWLVDRYFDRPVRRWLSSRPDRVPSSAVKPSET